VAVLACGVDRPYPLAHAGLLQQIAAHGLTVSEAPPGRLARRDAFLARNRINAALAGSVVVVEAGLRSGTMNTARHADALGRR
jgi:DNA processing protein